MQRNFFFSFLFHARKADSALTPNPPVGAASLTNFQYHLKLQGYPTQKGIWRHVDAIAQCRELIASYRAAVLSTEPSALTLPTRKSHCVPADVSYHFCWALSCIIFAMIFYHIRLSNHWCRPCAVGCTNCLVMLLLEYSEYIFTCNHLMAYPVRVPRAKNLCLRPSLWSLYLAPCVFFLVDFLLFWLSAQRSVMLPQLSLSTVLVWLLLIVP